MMFSWLGYGQLDYGRINLSYSKILLPLFTVDSCLSAGNTALCRTAIKRYHYGVKCSISDQAIFHKHLTDMQRMYLYICQL